MSLGAAVLVYATRYALGRRSGAASDMEAAIAANLHVLQRDRGCLDAMIRDIEESGVTMGSRVELPSWRRAALILARDVLALAAENERLRKALADGGWEQRQ